MESFAGMVSEHYLMESFNELLGDIKATMEVMAVTKNYLNVFEGKDIYEQEHWITRTHQIIMHLYLRQLNSKRIDEEECFDYKITPYTEFYEDLVIYKTKCELNRSIEECSDWDEDEKCLKPPTSAMFGNVDLESDESQSDESGHSNTPGNEQENSSNNLIYNIPNVESDDSGNSDGCTSDEEKNINNSYITNKCNVQLQSDESGVSDNNSVFDWSILVDTDEYRSAVIERMKSDVALGQYTFIQSHADLQAAKTLFYDELYSQSVFSTSQSVEKSLKSLARLFASRKISSVIKKHCAVEIFSKFKGQLLSDASFATYGEQLDTLCSMFESIGNQNWRGKYTAPMSIRSRYFQHDDNYGSKTKYQYYLETNPSSAFTYQEANEAIQIAEDIFAIIEYIFEEYCKKIIAN